MERKADGSRIVKFGLLTVVAVGGSLIFGAAAGEAVSHRLGAHAAILLTLSTGCSWLVLGALLWGFTRRPIFTLAEICLVTMAYGEAVLVSGAVFDEVLVKLAQSTFDLLPLNIAIVLVSNVLMATMFVVQLKRLGVAVKLAVSLWVLGLVGSWPVFLWLFGSLLGGGGR